MVQNQAIRFIIMNIKGLKDSITTAAREQLELETLQDRRKWLKMSFLMRILSKKRMPLSVSYIWRTIEWLGKHHYNNLCCCTWRTHIYIRHNPNLSQQLPSLNCERSEGQNSSYLWQSIIPEHTKCIDMLTNLKIQYLANYLTNYRGALLERKLAI